MFSLIEVFCFFYFLVFEKIYILDSKLNWNNNIKYWKSLCSIKHRFKFYSQQKYYAETDPVNINILFIHVRIIPLYLFLYRVELIISLFKVCPSFYSKLNLSTVDFYIFILTFKMAFKVRSSNNAPS